MGSCCSSKNVTEPQKVIKKGEEEDNILDSPFTRQARRSIDGTLKEGQVPLTVAKAYDKLLEEHNYFDINEAFTQNPIPTNPFMEPWKEIPVVDSKYLVKQGLYYKPPLSDPQPEYLTDVSHEQLSILNIQTSEIFHFSNNIFTQSSRAICLPSGVIFICGGKNCKSTFSLEPRTGKVTKLDNLFEGREYHSIAYINEYVIASGGFGYEQLDSCELFFRGKWSSTGFLNEKRSMHSSVGFENCVYVVGGLNQRSIEKWENHKWSLLKVSLEANFSRIGVCAVDAYTLIVVGGERSGVEYNTKAWEIDVNKERIEMIWGIDRIGFFDSFGSFYQEKCYFFMAESLFVYDVQDKYWKYGTE